MSSKSLPVSKVCISLPQETVAQLEYLASAWCLPPTAKRSQIIQQAIWQAYITALSHEDDDCKF